MQGQQLGQRPTQDTGAAKLQEMAT
jgi:hypothetical protein